MPLVIEAVPALLILAAVIVAYGLIVFGKAIVDVLFWIIRNTIGKIPFAGHVVNRASGAAFQYLSNKLGSAADAVGGALGKTWHTFAYLVERTGLATWHLALAVERIYAYVTNPVNLAKLIIKTSPFVLAFRWLRAHLDTVTNVTNVIHKSIVNPVSSSVGAAVRVVVRVDKVALKQLSAWTHAKVARLEHALAHAGSVALPVPGTALGDATGALARLRARLRKLEAGALPYIASGVFVTTLARFGLDWLRCRNVKTFGRGVCRMDTDALDALLVGSTLIVGSISIRQLARELEAAMDEATGMVRGFIREA